MTPRLLKLIEAAERLNCGPRTVRRRIADGTLIGYRLAGSRAIRVDEADVDRLLRRIPTARHRDAVSDSAA
jgi:excisionase family DNA binding protein